MPLNNLAQLFIFPILVGLFLSACGWPKRWSRKQRVIVAASVFVVALVLSYVISEHRAWVLAGTVVDRATEAGIGQVQISVVGHPTTYSTEDNGNFRIEVSPGLFGAERVEIHVTKHGYFPLDKSFEPPVEGIILRMEKP